MANYSPLAAIFNFPNVLQDYMTDVISTQNSLIWWLMGKPVNTGAGLKPTAKKFVREIGGGGSRFEVPLMLTTNPNAKTYAKDDTFNLTANDMGDRAYFNIQLMGTTIPVYNYDVALSDGSNAAIKGLVKNFMEQASITMLNLFVTNLYRAGGTEGANDWNSIFTLVSETPTADNIGGISSAAYPQWANQYKDETGISIGTYGVKELNKYTIKSTFGVARPKLYVVDETIYAGIFNAQQGQQRFVPDADLAKIGFEALDFMGKPMFFDHSTITGTALGINPDALELGFVKGYNMKVDPPVRVPNADLEVSFMKSYGNLLIRDRRTNFVLFNLTTA